MASTVVLKALDLFSSTDTAIVDLDGRVAQFGGAWEKVCPGFVNFDDLMRVQFADSAANNSPKRVIRGPAAVGTFGAYKLPVDMLHDAMEVMARISVVPPGAGTTAGIGIGFVRATFPDLTAAAAGWPQGVFFGWRWMSPTDARPMLYWLYHNLVNPVLTVVSLFAEMGDLVNFGLAPFTKQLRLRYSRLNDRFVFRIPGYKADLLLPASYFGEDAESVAGMDQPSIMFERQSDPTAPPDKFMELVGWGSGQLGGVNLAADWKPYGKGYVYEAELDFAAALRYSVQLEATLDGSTRIRARSMVFATYDATADVEIFVNNARNIVKPGRELVLPAPDTGAVDVQGSLGSVTLRLYTQEYSPLQRD